MKGCQTILLTTNTHTHTHTHEHIYNPQMHTHMQKNHTETCIYETHTMVINQLAESKIISGWGQTCRMNCSSLPVNKSTDWLTFPAAFGFAPLSRRSSATSTFPYLEATWRGVKPFYSNEEEEEKTKMFVKDSVASVHHNVSEYGVLLYVTICGYLCLYLAAKIILIYHKTEQNLKAQITSTVIFCQKRFS